ncbi:hypothetical protein Vafri_4787 [Volvox africanus]|uniref:Amine oxidase domain-containing protein n=1 Tax=Volvox africanus TaxID=51714 RepID=A0A8J4EXN9_9CHLO|nr:hypothetical protein Vafri_4787 [Volvox africanus]
MERTGSGASGLNLATKLKQIPPAVKHNRNDQRDSMATIRQPQPTRQSQPSTGPPRSPIPLDPVEKARRQMGYRNNWNRKLVDQDSQVRWSEPLSLNPSVAIIGGGMSGLMCARELARLGIRSTVFDTGKHGVGGRMATRASGEPSLRSGTGSRGKPEVQLGGLRFDHAAQFFTVTDPLFQDIVDEWLEEGVVRVWDGPVGKLRADSGAFYPLPPSPPRYVATGGMRSLAEGVVEQLLLQREGAGSEGRGPSLVEVKRPVWVGKMQAEEGRGWALQGEGRLQGVYDVVVIAHNGKCANRLVGPAGSPRVAEQLMRLRLNAVWALMVAFDGPVPAPFEGAFIQGSPVLSWAGNNTAKMQLRHSPSDLECWTIFSTNAYGQANKVPQEAIPADVADKIAGEMLAAFRQATSGTASSSPAAGRWPRPVFTRVQLWGAALPLNTPGLPYILDPDSRVGVCGDWLMGGSLQAAAVSGISLARKIAGLRGKSGPEQLAPFRLGLNTQFTPLRTTDIGEFPH